MAGQNDNDGKAEKSMAKKSTSCIATSRAQAEQIVRLLKDEGFSSKDISVLLPDQISLRGSELAAGTMAAEGAMAGAMLGGTLGWLAGVGALAVPGVGPLVAAGPIVASLTGVAMGGVVGTIGGALMSLGIPESDAKHFEGKLAAGNILISVHSNDSQEIKIAGQIFEHSGAQDVSTAGVAGREDRTGISTTFYITNFAR